MLPSTGLQVACKAFLPSGVVKFKPSRANCLFSLACEVYCMCTPDHHTHMWWFCKLLPLIKRHKIIQDVRVSFSLLLLYTKQAT